MHQKKITISFILLLCISASLLWIVSSYGITEKQAYFKAETCYKKLRNSPSKMRYRDNWLRCIEKFQRVYRLDPSGPWAPAGLFMAGELYLELAKRSKKKSDQQEARDIYERIIKRFPGSRYRDKAAAKIRTLSSNGISKKEPAKSKSVRTSERTAEDEYQSAESCYSRLRQNSRKMKYRHNWLQCIEKFYSIYRKNPSGERAAAGLYMTGKLYADLYQYSKRKSDLRAAHTMYERVIAKFPDSRYRVKASLLIDSMPQWVKKKALKSVVVLLPETVKYMFGKVLAKERKSIVRAIKECVDSQNIFEKNQIRQLLLRSSFAKICQFRDDLESNARRSGNLTSPRTEAITFLHKLADLKAIFGQHAYAQKLLSLPEPRMSAHDILTLMFHVVLNNMYRSSWQPLFGEAVNVCDMPDEETIIEATV